MPSFSSPVFTGLVADVLCMYTVLRVLPCYRIVLPCYRCSVTGNSLRIVCIGMLFGYWLLAASSALTLTKPIPFTKVIALLSRALNARVRARINRRGSRRGRGRSSSRANMYSSNPNLRKAKLKKRSKKTTPQTRMNTGVGEIDQLMV